jgi:hypothetical protein
MRRQVFASLLLATAGLAVPPAQATPDQHYEGGCGLTTVNDASPGAQAGGPEVWYGEVDVLAVATNTNGTPAAVPINVSCDLYVDGALQPTSAVASGLGAAARVSAVTYLTATVDTPVVLCERVTVATEVSERCYPASHAKAVPDEVVEVFDQVADLLDPGGNGEAFRAIHLAMCFLLRTVPGLSLLVTLHPYGDVSVLRPGYDCPPYSQPFLGMSSPTVATVRHP